MFTISLPPNLEATTEIPAEPPPKNYKKKPLPAIFSYGLSGFSACPKIFPYENRISPAASTFCTCKIKQLLMSKEKIAQKNRRKNLKSKPKQCSTTQ